MVWSTHLGKAISAFPFHQFLSSKISPCCPDLVERQLLGMVDSGLTDNTAIGHAVSSGAREIFYMGQVMSNGELEDWETPKALRSSLWTRFSLTSTPQNQLPKCIAAGAPYIESKVPNSFAPLNKNPLMTCVSSSGRWQQLEISDDHRKKVRRSSCDDTTPERRHQLVARCGTLERAGLGVWVPRLAGFLPGLRRDAWISHGASAGRENINKDY